MGVYFELVIDGVVDYPRVRDLFVATEVPSGIRVRQTMHPEFADLIVSVHPDEYYCDSSRREPMPGRVMISLGFGASYRPYSDDEAAIGRFAGVVRCARRIWTVEPAAVVTMLKDYDLEYVDTRDPAEVVRYGYVITPEIATRIEQLQGGLES